MSSQNTSETPIGKPPSIKPTVPIVVAAPAVGYVTAFAFEANYLAYFGLPAQLVSLSLTSIFNAAGVLSTLVFVFFMTIQVFAAFVRPSDGPYFRVGLVLLPGLLLLVGFIKLFGWALWQYWIWVAGFFVFTIVLEFGWPVLFGGRGRSYREKLEDLQEPSTLGRIMNDVFGFGNVIGLVLGLMLLSLAFAGGKATAARQQDFYLVDGGSEFVIRVYDDYLVTAKFDRADSSLVPEYRVLTMTEAGKHVLRKARIGPIAVGDE